MQTVEQALAAARAALSNVDTPALDARLLLQAATGMTHAELIAEPRRGLPDHVVREFEASLARRAAGEPVSRILGTRDFYDRPFRVTPAVLDPRPDTECLVSAALALMPLQAPSRFLDLGTGSGILAITLLAERPHAKGVAIDISTEALQVASDNAADHHIGGRLSLQHGNWFDGIDGTFDVIVSNPPYIETNSIEGLAAEVRLHDPLASLDGGQDGLACYRNIAAGSPQHLAHKGFIAVEIGKGQEFEVIEIFVAHGFACTSQHRDLAGIVRCLVFHHAGGR